MYFGTYCRLNVTCFDSPLTVLRAARLKIAPHHRTGPAKRAARHEFYRAMLDCHRDAARLAREFRLLT